jgi:chromosome partitioning protein
VEGPGVTTIPTRAQVEARLAKPLMFLRMTTIYTFANQKGGVGKTTTAINVAAYLAAREKRVLLVDVDPQANATSSLGIDKTAPTFSIYHALIDDVPLDQIIMLTKRLHLDLVPSSAALAGAEVELVALERREHLLANLLTPIAARYDYIFIDSPPSLGLLTVKRARCCRRGHHSDSVRVSRARRTLAVASTRFTSCNRVLNPRLRIGGMAMTMYDSRTHLALQVVEQVAQHFPDLIFHTIIPRSVRIAEAPSFGEPLVSFDPKSRGAQAYEALTQELLDRESQLGAHSARALTTKNKEKTNGMDSANH